jgi:hypothetical protein
VVRVQDVNVLSATRDQQSAFFRDHVSAYIPL